MIAKTGKQLAETKRNERRKPATEAKKSTTKKSGEAAAINGEESVAGMQTTVKKPWTQKVTRTAAEDVSNEPKRGASSAADCRGNDDGSEKAAEPKTEQKSNEAAGKAPVQAAKEPGDTVKPLTEAGKKRLVNKLLGLADSQVSQGTFKLTPADLIRLMQLHREMNPQRDRKVTVQWVEDKSE